MDLHLKSKEELIEEIKMLRRELNRNSEGVPNSEFTKDFLFQGTLKFRTLINTMSEGVLYVNTDGLIQFVNNKLCDMFGYEREELIGKVANEVFPYGVEDRKIVDYEKELRKKGISDTFTIRNRRKNGEPFWSEVSGAPVKNDDGKVIGSVGIIQDITERKAGEDILLKHDAIMQALNYCSGQFLGAGEWDKTITEGLKKLGEAADVSRVYIFENFQRNGVLFTSQRYEYCAAGIDPQIDNQELQEMDFALIGDRWAKLLSENKEIHGNIKDFPEEERSLLEPQDIKSILVVPIKVNGKPWGFMGYDENRGERIWQDSEIQALKTAADLFGAAIEHKKAVSALKKSEEDFRLLFELAPTGMAIAKFDGELVRVNQTLCYMLGYNSEELLGKKFTEITHPDDIGLNLALDDKLLKDKMPYFQMEKRYVRKNGEIINALLTVALEKDAEENPTHFIAQVVDISGRKKMEEALRESEEEFRLIFENAPTGMAISTLDGKLVKINEAYCNFVDYSAEELLGMKFTDITHPEDLPLNLALDKQLIDGEIPFFQMEKRYISKKGKIKHAIIQVAIERDVLNKPIYLIAQVIDISDRKRVEEALKKSEQNYRTLFESANDAVFLEDEDENIVDVNMLACELTGYSKEELLKMKTIDMQPEEYLSYEKRKLERERFETVLVHKSGTIKNIEIALAEINRDDEVYILSIVRDITDRKKAEGTLKKAKEKAEESDRLKSHFLAQMSHEIRTPINAILGYSGLIKDEISDKLNNEQISNFEVIDSASQRLMRTIDLILSMSEIQTGNYKFTPKKIDIHDEVLFDLHKQFKVIADQKNLDFSLHNEAKDTLINGDEYSITQIFSNLFSNAIKYTPTGEVKVIINELGDKELWVKVADTGIGISEDYIPHLFTLFSQEEQGYTRKFEGNGLGLSLVKKYCEINNAEIEVESEKDKGSVFIVKFQK